ncbi:glycosyltransferase family 39 protein [Lichenicola sp.]|uniref:glycosyltransferase family 39 protein n=1 Tax=Lichenicola sp. TaxID=2804529 RepID=UPI003B005A38
MSLTVPRPTSLRPGPHRVPAPNQATAFPPTLAAPVWRHLELVLPLVLVCLVALVARLYGLDGKPYWMDEITTLRRSSLGLGALVRDSLSFHHLPLYFVVTSWFVPFGLNESVMRLPAAVFGAASCGVLFLLGRSLGDWRSGLAASLLLALAPFQVQYGQEARSYTLVTTLILLGLWGLALLARDPVAAAEPLRRRGPARTAWLLYGIGTAGALDTLSVANFWFLAANLGAAFIAFRSASVRRSFVRNWIVVQLLVLSVYLPFLAGMVVFTHGNMGSGLDWVPPLSLRNVWTTLQTVYLMRISSLIAFRIFPSHLGMLGLQWFGWIVAALALTGLVSGVRRGLVGGVIAIGLFTLPIGLAASAVVSSIWMPRYLLWSGPVFFLLAGLGLVRLPERLRTPGLALLAVLGVVNLLPYYQTETKPLWNQAAAELLQDRQDGDLLITDDPGTVNMMNVYLARTGHALKPGDWTTDVAEAKARHAAGARVWAVHGTVGQNDPYQLGSFLETLAPLGPVASAHQVGIDITMLLFAPDGT